MHRWTLDALDLDRFQADALDPHVTYIVRATCLLESRSERYRAYLEQVLPPGHHLAIAEWAAQERQHGEALQAWLELADPSWDFSAKMARYAELPYHEGAEVSVRGGVEEELLARCVVEALAAGYYRALRDATREPLLQQICTLLMADEARHFSMFRRLGRTRAALPLDRKLRVFLRRVGELHDDQIIYAAHVANHAGPYLPRRARAAYLSRVYPMYRVEHVRFIQAMLLGLLDLRPGPLVSATLERAALLWLRARRTRQVNPS